MQETNFKHSARDATEIHVYGWLCDSPKALVHINHGMAEHAARYGWLAASLCDAGYSVYAQDHRGHGKSIQPGLSPGHLADHDGWTKMVTDAHDINREIAGHHPGLPILALGHSMGSFVVQQLLYEQPGDFTAAALSGSNGKPPPIAIVARGIARVERRRLGKRSASPVIQRISFGEFNRAFSPIRTECDWLSRDTEQVDLYVEDPLCGFACSIQTWVDMLNALPKLASASNIARVDKDIPLLIFAGDKDPVGDNGAGVQRLAKAYDDAGLRHVQLKLYHEGRHETLNETNRQEVASDFITWCEQTTDKLR